LFCFIFVLICLFLDFLKKEPWISCWFNTMFTDVRYEKKKKNLFYFIFIFIHYHK
jgi:hypothetical protein